MKQLKKIGIPTFFLYQLESGEKSTTNIVIIDKIENAYKFKTEELVEVTLMPYDEKGQYYDRKSKVGNTTVYVVNPKITEEERVRRLKSLESTMSNLLNCKVSLSFKR